jgi:hypothetical protein
MTNYALERSRSSLTLMVMNTICATTVSLLVARRRV